ncbi:PAF-acetylhydrolase family member [Massariosphaeria phaeospora]|uniref:Putative phospholipase n=1 Tax=Massariosphaeria phaeospora TaxID=100035 RepID=A0A7C8I6A2_9PLEO|nr:PAF-acetylhydrolase family member [Massariosphaeria phaeospora]
MVFGLRRFSPRRFLFFGSAFFVFGFLVYSLTPFTEPLPPYTGPHEVGILDVETEVKRRVINEAKLKETGERLFELETLAITLYYPVSMPPTPRNNQPHARPWLPQPISLIGTGYARMCHIYFPPLQAVFTFLLWFLGSKTVIPGHVDAPLISAPEKVLLNANDGPDGMAKIMLASQEVAKGENEAAGELGDLGTLPCVVFTHGMAGMSQSYSHYLGSIASHGYVVAAVEHRDGSGPGTIVHYADGKERKFWHIQVQDIESEPPMKLADLQKAQLAYREAELEETINLFRRLNAGEGMDIRNLKPESPEESLPGFKNRLNLSAITVAGHSYGATGALQALKNAPSKSMPINGGIALDPGKGSGPLNKEIDVPLLVMQSGQWTEKQTQFYGQGWHFDVVRKVVEGMKEGWFITLTGTAHPSCTDAPLIVPWIMKLVTGTTLNPRVALKEYIDVSVEFLEFLRNGDKKGVIKSDVTSPTGPLGDAEKRGKVKGKAGADWEVHVVPQT